MIPEAKTLTWRYCNATLETIDVQKIREHWCLKYHQTCNISCISVDKKIVDHSDVVWAAPVQLHLHSRLYTGIQWIGQRTTSRRDEKHLRVGIWCDLYQRFDGITHFCIRHIIFWCEAHRGYHVDTAHVWYRQWSCINIIINYHSSLSYKEKFLLLTHWPLRNLNEILDRF